MGEINFDKLFDGLKDGVIAIAKASLQDYENEAKADGQKALDNIKTNLQEWAKEMETGELTRDDLAFLLKENEELEEMVALKQAGLAAIHIDQFKNNLINMIISTVTSFIKI